MTKKGPQENIDLHYIKANGFRVVHADGVWGGPTPRGYITMSFFSERAPIPRTISFELESQGTLGEETSRDTKGGLIREVDVEVVVDLRMAKSLVGWLNEKVQNLEDQDKKKGGSS